MAAAEQTLVLNATWEPVKVVDWRRAITLWWQDKVEIVAEHDREVRAVTFTFKLPSVVRLLRFVKVRGRRHSVPFTRANIYRRDGYTCAYCAERFVSKDLTFDHVIPAARGGPKSWENIVTACVPCNRRKGARTPEEAGLVLRRAPRRPAPSPIFRVSIGIGKTPESWRSFLYWHTELES
jgi:5-methylcytosine-specific restriction endonuclease McrA